MISIEELKNIIKVFEDAIQDHTAWFMGWHRAVICNQFLEGSDQYMREDAHCCCKFGKWYYGNEKSYLASFPLFLLIEKTHKLIHDTGRALLLVSSHGQKISIAEYDEFLKLREEFRDLLRVLDTDLHNTLLETDPLTLVLTRHGLLPFLQDCRTRLEDYQESSIVCMLDIDHFKRVNDTHGHLVGDQVLVAVASFLSTHLRQNDKIFRYGGEEFLIVLVNSSLISACRVADRLRILLAQHMIVVKEDLSLQITASFGLAALRPSVDVNDIVSYADKALYAAKERGRNQVYCAILDGVVCVTKPLRDVAA